MGEMRGSTRRGGVGSVVGGGAVGERMYHVKHSSAEHAAKALGRRFVDAVERWSDDATA